MSHQVEPIAGHSIVKVAVCGIIVVVEMIVRTKVPVLRNLELRPIQSAAAGPGASAVTDLAAVKDFLFIRNEGRIEIAIRMAWIFETMSRRVSIGHRVNVMGGYNESRRAKIPGDASIICHKQGRRFRAFSGNDGRCAVLSDGRHIELDDLPLQSGGAQLS